MNEQIPIGWKECLCLYALDEDCNDKRDLELERLNDPRSSIMFKSMCSHNGFGCPVYSDRRLGSIK